MTHLDHCPFCNSTTIAVSLRYDGLYINDPERKDHRRYVAYAARCEECGASGPLVKVDEHQHDPQERHDAVEEAADLWNAKRF